MDIFEKKPLDSAQKNSIFSKNFYVILSKELEQFVRMFNCHHIGQSLNFLRSIERAKTKRSPEGRQAVGL